MLNDTIAAIATPLGEGGLAVIRISGRTAIQVADACFRKPSSHFKSLSEVASHTLHYGHVRHGGRVVDEAMAAVFRAPRSFTREDVVELSCHGGITAAKSTLEAVLASGARLAEPGEFTRRAFLNGRIDLAQAEAVADAIHARTSMALAAAQEQLSGRLSRRSEAIRESLVSTLAHVEAHIDFPDEDISPDTRDQLIRRLRDAAGQIADLLATADDGQVLRRGIRAAIVGKPNAGKSSLLNQLLGRDRAIVSPQAGTTRDTIEETANVRGIPIVFVDTAGLRDSEDAVEQEGIRRSLHNLQSAELILLVVDGTALCGEDDADQIRRLAGRKAIVLRNKSDLGVRFVPPPEISQVLDISCSTGQGIEELKTAITRLVWSGKLGADMSDAMINSRHQDALRRAGVATEAAARVLQGEESLEIAAMELRIGLNAVGEITGKTSTEDLLDSIFSQFCIGK